MPADTSEFTPDMLVEFNITLHMQYCVLHLNRATQKQSCFWLHSESTEVFDAS